MVLEVPPWLSRNNSDFFAPDSSVSEGENDSRDPEIQKFDKSKNDVIEARMSSDFPSWRLEENRGFYDPSSLPFSATENDFGISQTWGFGKRRNYVVRGRSLSGDDTGLSCNVPSRCPFTAGGINMDSATLPSSCPFSTNSANLPSRIPFSAVGNDVVGEKRLLRNSTELLGNNLHFGTPPSTCLFSPADDKRSDNRVGEEKQVLEDCDYIDGNFCPFSESDFEALKAETSVGDEDIADPFFRGNWKEGQDFRVYFLGSKKDMDVVGILTLIACYLDICKVDPNNLDEIIKQESDRFRDMHDKVRKGYTSLVNATFVNLQLISALKYYRNFNHICRVETDTVLSNPNLCHKNHELANLIGFLYDKEPEPATLHCEGSLLPSWKACKFMAGFQGRKMLAAEGGLPIYLEGSKNTWKSQDSCPEEPYVSRQMKRDKDPWQGCSTRMLYDTGHTSTLENPFTRTNYNGYGSIENCCSQVSGGEPHEAIFFALAYLSPPDLLSVERICKSLRDAVRNDPLLWRTIHVGDSLRAGLTDDALLKLVARSQGQLEHLCLLSCMRITFDGLKQVLAISPKLTELCLPYCFDFTGEGIVNIVKTHKEFGKPGLKLLKIHGISDVTRDHVEKLKNLLDGGLQQKSQVVKPRFYPYGHHYSVIYDDDRLIDIELCPKCGKEDLVYDCTGESCRGKECRGCIFCISRCKKCGRCIDFIHDDYEETSPKPSVFDLLCADCSLDCQLRRAVEPWLPPPMI